MQHKCKLTVIDKKLYPELQAQYCADPNSGVCPCYNVGDEYIFERYGKADHFWHMGIGTLTKAGSGTEGIAGSAELPHCSEAWDAVSRYIYTALQGGSIMRGWMNDERVMITCCSDGTRPVIFKIERLDYKVLYIDGIGCEKCEQKISSALKAIPEVNEVVFRHEDGFTEVYLERDVPDEVLKQAVEGSGGYTVTKVS
ncbi:MAG: TIGR04076 family protein [Acetatifactor sp.]|nr:TIGR04076 family protein [Acetatifactor sp.]